MPDKLRDNLREAYDAGAMSRDRSDLPQWRRSERAGFLSHLRSNKMKHLLEIGAGTGRDGSYFANAGCEVTCVDLSPAMIRLCHDKGLTALVMDAADLSFQNESFDAAYSFNSLLHLPKAELPAVLMEIRRVLVPGGLFYFGTYGGHDHEGIYEKDDHTPWRFFSFYEDEHLECVVGEAFDVLEFRSVATPGDTPQIHFQSILLQRPDIGYARPNKR